jgi:hypothetical protein
MDQLMVEVPAGVEGCNVPVNVAFADGSGTSTTFIAIATGTGVCSDAHGLSEPEVRAMASGNLQAALIDATQESGGIRWTIGIGTAAKPALIPHGTCQVGWPGPGFAVVEPRPENAGSAIAIQTPVSSVDAVRFPGNYYRGVSPGGLNAGRYVFENGAGGPEAGPFRAELTLPQQSFTWINRNEITSVARSEGTTVWWKAEDPASSRVIVTVSLNSQALSCSELPDKGHFTISPRLLQLLEAMQHDPGWDDAASAGFSISVSLRVSKRLSVSGLNFAEFGTTIPGGMRTVPLM